MRHCYQTTWKLSEWGWDRKRVGWSTEARWSGCIKHLKQPHEIIILLFLIYIPLRQVSHQGEPPQHYISIHRLHFHAKFIYWPCEKVSVCEAPFPLILTQIHLFKRALLLVPNQAFLLSPNWLICTIKSSIKTQKMCRRIAPQKIHHSETAPIIIARQNKYGGGGCPAFLWYSQTPLKGLPLRACSHCKRCDCPLFMWE